MTQCQHRWEMTDIRSGYLVVEGCTKCGGRTSFFSAEPAAPIDEYHEGEHFWINLGSSQAVKFNLKCTACDAHVDLDDMMGLMLSTCEDPNCEIARIGQREGPGTWVYIAFCADNTHTRRKGCVSQRGIDALNQYFNQNLKGSNKKIMVVPCRQCCNLDRCTGIVIADAGLTEIY